MTSVITSSIEDITKPEKKAIKYKGDETPAERIKKQKHEFFTLLTAQLKNQDPLAPMDTTQMTQQIFSINSVEQQLETNKHLEELKGHFEIAQDTSYINYIGKNVTFEGNKVVLHDNSAQLNYELLEEAAKAKLVITDKFGNKVDELAIATRIGRGQATWKKPENIKGDDFKFRVEAYNSDDNEVKNKTYTTGLVEGLINEDGKRFFSIGGKLLPIEKVKDVMINFADLDKTNNITPPAKQEMQPFTFPPDVLAMLQKSS